MRLTPDTRNFEFLNFLQVLEIFCRAHIFFFLKNPEKKISASFSLLKNLENFPSPSKEDIL